MEQRTLKIGDRVVYCYEDGSVEFLSTAVMHSKHPLTRTFGSKNNKGYKRITLIINGKKHVLAVHRLIALAFHPNPNGYLEIDHINRNKEDNRPSNLRWCDSKTNQNNKRSIDSSIARYGVRQCADQKAYKKAYNKSYNDHVLAMVKPDGSKTKTGFLSPEVYDALKPLSQKQRYIKYQELRKA